MIKYEQKTWLSFIAVGLAGLVFLIGLASFVSVPSKAALESADPKAEAAVTPVTVDEYQSQVQAILQQYITSSDAQTAADALLQLYVPVDFKETHLNLVLTLNAIQRGESGATERLNQLIENISWLSL